MQEIFIAPFLLGLSAGIYCLTFCIPFVAPVMIAEARQKKENFLVLAKFISGRFFGYIAFGAIFGYLGERLNNPTLNIILNSALILLALLLISHALGAQILQSKTWAPKRFSFCRAVRKHNPQIPLLMGFLMGVNICPPFLMSLTYVFTLHSVFKGVIYFLMFFVGTTLYFLPLFFLGYLNKRKEFQWVGRLSALIVGILFLTYALSQIFS